MADDSPPAAVEKPASQSAPENKLRWLIAAIAVAAWACLRFPQSTMTQGLDPSWTAVLIHAHEKGLQFGRDIVFTYGPLGFLSIECFSPHAITARIIFEVLVAIGIATGLGLVAWRTPLRWRLGMLAYFVFISTPLHWGGDALFLDLGIFAWGLLCVLETGPRLRTFVVALVVLAALAALVKFTFLVISCFTIGMIACDLAVRRRPLLAAASLSGLVLAFMLGWILLGQSPAGLGDYLSNSFAVSSGYNAAMGAHTVSLTWVLAMTLAALAAVTIRAAAFPVDRMGLAQLRRGLLWIWLSGVLFVEWKYGAVRTDSDHVTLMLGVIPVGAMCLEALPAAGKEAAHWGRVASLLSVIAALMFIHSQIGSLALAKCIKRTCENLYENLEIMALPGRYVREKTEAAREEQKKDQLPKIRAAVGNSTADVFGDNQGFAFLNGLNYAPRPAFQSYTAYNRRMMELNEQFYLSKYAPEYVLFNLQALDGRFPPLEDSWVLRDLLNNYKMIGGEADYLLLQQKATAKPQMTLLKEITIRAGEKIDLPKEDAASLWLEIDIQPTLPGRLRQFLYKPPDTDLVIWSESTPASPVKYKAPAIMLAAGFLASPVMLNNQDAMNYLTGGKGQRTEAFAVETGVSAVSWWQPEIRCRIYRIEK